MEENLIASSLDGNWWEWDGAKFATAQVIADALGLTYNAINRYEEIKGLKNYNSNPTAPGQDHLYSLAAVKEIKKNLGQRKKKPLTLRVEKV